MPIHWENIVPLSLLNSFTRIFEMVLSTRLVHLFKKFNVIANRQNDFRRGKGMETTFFELARKMLWKNVISH